MSVPIFTKRHAHNVVLCYHGCVLHRADVLTFREHIDDWKAQIRDLQAQGYAFVKPSDYLAWYDGTWTPPGPIACCHLDDGLASIKPICDWMVAEGIPFGLAIIGRRQKMHEPDSGFASWAMLNGYVNTGLAELMSHTFNMHHLGLIQRGLVVDVGPVMEGPCWLDNGDVVYRDATDTRYYWDFSHVDGATWGFPLFGSDPYTGFTTTITSTLTLKAKWTGTLRVLRLWMALGRPYGGGYDAQVEVRINGTLRWSGTISPKDYGTRKQWVEREFYSILLDTWPTITAGSTYTIEFKTLNLGPAVGLIYVIPDFTGDFNCVTSCKGLSLAPDGVTLAQRVHLADFPDNYPWPARPAIIMADGTGSVATDAQYQAYIEADLLANNSAINDWLKATWTERAQTYAGNPLALGQLVIGGQYSDGSLANTVIPFDCPATHTARVLRFKNSGPAGLERYPMLMDVYIGSSVSGPWTLLTRYASRWNTYKWEEIDIPATVLNGATRYWFRFQTVNANPWGGQCLQRVYLDATFAVSGGGDTPKKITAYWDFSGVDFALNKRTALPLKDEASDRWPTSPLNIWTGDKSLDKQVDGWVWAYDSAYVVGNAYIETLSVAQSPAAAPVDMIYPFGAFYENGTGSVVAQNIKEVSPPLAAALTTAGMDSGFTIYPARYEKSGGLFREPSNRYTRHALGRLLVYGTVNPLVTVNNISAFASTMFQDAQHGGVRWQTSIEPDPAGNATIKHSVAALDFVAFDAWFLDGAGDIAKGALNDGGTYLDYTPGTGIFTVGETITEATSGATAVIVWVQANIGTMRVSTVTGTWTGGLTFTGGTSGATGTGAAEGPQAFADDRAWLQARGVRCLLILNNNLGTGEPDPVIGAHVVNNPSIYIPKIVSAASGWDGVTMNLEAIPAADRAAATSFYRLLATELHAAGKLLHATAPAITGTAYDAAWWCGWCDLNEIAKVVDAVKVLTYTESGPGTMPGSASPTWHFEATMEWVKAHVFEPMWPRLMIGARAYGHMWNDPADLNDVTYLSYADAMATAMLAGVEIRIADGEAYWTDGTRVCWFGTPETVMRSVKAAVSDGFGGVGIWKADDGDLYEHWPVWPQIGKDEMAAFSEERFPDDWAWFATGGPRYKTHITAGDSDYESRISVGDLGLRRYSLSRVLHSQAELDLFMSFWQLRRGSYEGFRFKDWRDYKTAAQYLGTGNGTQTGFQLRKAYSNTDPVTGASSTTYREIKKPVPGTVKAYLNGVEQTSGWTVNTATGLISFSVAPANGVLVTADCEFDVPVRFVNDAPPLQFDAAFGLSSLASLKFSEVRL